MGHRDCLLVLLLFVMGVATEGMAGDRFDRIAGVFQAADRITASQLPQEGAWAGFCTGRDDSVDDALLALRKHSDPVIGDGIKALPEKTAGSSNSFLRMASDLVRDLVEKSDPSRWTEGQWVSDSGPDFELLLLSADRQRAVLRRVGEIGAPDSYLVLMRQCRSIDGRSCNGSAPALFMDVEACHYFQRKF